MIPNCVHEQAVVAAVLSRRWAAASEDLKRHASSCEICCDVATIAGLLAAEEEQSRHHVLVPAAGQVWWRSAVRARLEAAQTAARPMTWLHGIAGACALGLTWALAGIVWPWVRQVMAWLAMQILGADSGVDGLAALVTALLQKSLPLAFVVAACLVLAPVALYFVLSEEKG